MIIAVDGASGTGKSTICKLIAEELDLSYLDTGAIYRSVALITKEKKISLHDEVGLKKICNSLDLRFEFKDGQNHIYIANRDVSEDIRRPDISMLASKVSALPVVRASLLDMQQRFAKESKKKGVIVDGRDISTVVFPNADIKIFLTASNEVRAKRRFDELKGKGMNVEYKNILAETIQRDKQDSERSLAPLKKAKDAVELNTDGLNINQVKEKIKCIINKKVK